MSDLALVWQNLSADCAIYGADLQRDEGLETAVILSLFLDRRARADDVIPDGTTNRRGWWADTVQPEASAGPQGKYDQHGSRLWLLHREKELPEVMRRAKDYATEGLAWMLEDGVARKVDVVATNPRSGWLVLDIAITVPDGTTHAFSFGKDL